MVDECDYCQVVPRNRDGGAGWDICCHGNTGDYGGNSGIESELGINTDTNGIGSIIGSVRSETAGRGLAVCGDSYKSGGGKNMEEVEVDDTYIVCSMGKFARGIYARTGNPDNNFGGEILGAKENQNFRYNGVGFGTFCDFDKSIRNRIMA